MNWDKIILAALVGAVISAARAWAEESQKPKLPYKRQWRL
jgi:hypothetical protein